MDESNQMDDNVSVKNVFSASELKEDVESEHNSDLHITKKSITEVSKSSKDDSLTKNDISSTDPAINSSSPVNLPTKVDDEVSQTPSSISEHIEISDAVKSTEDNSCQRSRDISIPSLDLKSLTKTNSEYDKSYSSREFSKSNMSATSDQENNYAEESAENMNPSISSEGSKTQAHDVTPEALHNNVNRTDNREDLHISNESSIHTQLDWTDASHSPKNTSLSEHSTPSKRSRFSPRSERISQLYLDAPATDPPLCMNADKCGVKAKPPSKSNSSSSEEVIKLDIRGQATTNRQLPYFRNIFFPSRDNIPTTVQEHDFITINNKIVNLASLNPSHPSSQKNALADSEEKLFSSKLNETSGSVFDNKYSNLESDYVLSGADQYEQDRATEELILNESRDTFPSREKEDNVYNKPAGEGESLSTVTTEYKTLCEDYHHKIPELQTALFEKDTEIEQLKASLQHSSEYRDQLQIENEHLSNEVGNLQQLLSDATSMSAEVKGQLSDFVKHENMTMEDADSFPVILKHFEEGNCEANFKPEDKISSCTQTVQCEEYYDNRAQDGNNIVDSNYLQLSEAFLEVFDNIQNELPADYLSSFNMCKDKIINSLEMELKNKCDIFYSYSNKFTEMIACEKNNHTQEIKRLRDLILNIKSDNPEISKLRKEMDVKHKSEMEELRTYFEKRCGDIEKNYSEEVFSQHSKKMSVDSSTDSLNNCPEALPFGSPLHEARHDPTWKGLQRSHSAEFGLNKLNETSHAEKSLRNMKAEHREKIKEIISKHEAHVAEMEDSYKEQIAELKANLQTFQNTVIQTDLLSFEHRDTDMELEKQKDRKSSPKEIEAVEALLSEPHPEHPAGGCPLELSAAREKAHADALITLEQLKMTHAEELSALRNDNAKQLALITDKHKQDSEKWKQKRNEAFDKNRCLEDAMKERDGLKHMVGTFRTVLSQLVEYFNLCEDELNNTFVGELLKQILVADENFDNTIVLSTFSTDKFDTTFNESITSTDLNKSAVSEISMKSKRMHFAPNVNGIMTFIDSGSILDCLDQSQDISINFKHELDTCLKRLRMEAQELLVLSTRNVPNRLSILPPKDDPRKEDDNVEPKEVDADSNLQIIDYKYKYDDLQELYNKCEAERKELEDSLVQSMHQGVALKEELQAAMDKIGELMSDHFLDNTREIISEGYGIVTHPRTPVSLPPHPRVAITSPPPLLASGGNTPEGGRSLSLDGAIEKRTPGLQELSRRLACELEVATRDREDMQMQLEAANKQLRSTRQFLEEQATEREQERDEFQRELAQIKEENSKLVLKTQQNVRITKESSQCIPPQSEISHASVEQLELQMREMTTLINDLESQKNMKEAECQSSMDKIGILRDIIGNLECQLEAKLTQEAEILQELGNLKTLAEEREIMMTHMARELENVKSELAQRLEDEVLASAKGDAKISNQIGNNDFEAERKLVEQMRHQIHTLLEIIAEHTGALENLHEAVCSQSCSSPSEDVSVRDHKKSDETAVSPAMPSASPTKLILQLPVLEMSQLGDSLHRHLKAEDAAFKRIRDLEMQLVQLKDVAQELRAERDFLQERMFEQGLRISSLQSRLDQTRHTAEALRHQSTEDLRLQLDEALAEAQLLRESLDSRDKQVARLKELVESTKKRLGDQEQELSVCAGSSKEVIQRLKRELRDQQSKVRDLQDAVETSRLHQESLPGLLESVVADKNADIDLLRQQLLEKEQHLQAVLSLKLDEEPLKQLSTSDKDQNNDGKHSARTLSDILSISEFDEPDAILRKAELKPHSCISGQLIISPIDMKNHDATVLPETEEAWPIAASSAIHGDTKDNIIHSLQDATSHSPIEESLPMIDNLLSSNEKRSLLNEYKRNINETGAIGSSSIIKDKQEIKENDRIKLINNSNENCSMFPNKDCSSDKSNTIEPKRINFSCGNTLDNCKLDECNEHINRIDVPKSDQKDNNKNSYSDPKSFKELGINLDWKQNNYPDVLTQLKDKISILNDELVSKNAALQLAEEQLSEFPIVKKEMEELKCLLQNSLQTMQEDKEYYSNQLDKFASGEELLKQKLEQTILETNEQARELHILKEDIVRRENIVMELAKEKRNLQHSLTELDKKYQLVETREKMLECNSLENIKLREKLSDFEKLEQMISDKNLQIDNLNENLDKLDDLQRNVNEKEEHIEKLKIDLNNKYTEADDLQKDIMGRKNNEEYLRVQNSELIFNIKKLTDTNYNLKVENENFKDNLLKLEKEFESVVSEKESLGKPKGESENEEMFKFEEFKLLLNELDSPKSLEDQIGEKQIGHEKLKVEKIRKQISTLQSDLHAKNNELNAMVVELDEAKREITELKAQSEYFKNCVSEKDHNLKQLSLVRDDLETKLKCVMERLREEGNTEELRVKLFRKSEECEELERNVSMLRDAIDRNQRDAHSDRERDDRLQELSIENGRLKQQLCTYEGRLGDQETLIRELHGVRESLLADLQNLEQKSEEELDTSARLQLLLDTEKQMASNIQCQDSNVIQILRGRLEVSLDGESELQMLLDREKLSSEQVMKQNELLKKQLMDAQDRRSRGDGPSSDPGSGLQQRLDTVTSQLQDQVEICELLKSEVVLLKTKFEREKSRLVDLQNVLDREKLWFQKEIDAGKDQSKVLKGEVTELKRQKHEMHLELVHCREKIHLQKNEICSLEKRLALMDTQKGIHKSESYRDLMSDLEHQKAAFNAEVSSLKHNLELAAEREKKLQQLISSDGKLSGGSDNNDFSTLHHLKEMQSLLRRHITENVQMSETVKELTQERRDLQIRVRQLENQIKLGARHSQSMLNLPEGVDQQVRFLYSRYIRVDSYRKALLWQKRYLMGVAAALDDWRKRLGDPGRPLRSTGIQRFRCVVLSVKAIFRMKYLVKRWHTGSRIGANIHLNIPNYYPTELRTSKSYSHMPMCPGDNKDMKTRHSLTNPAANYHTPSTKPSNKSWSHGSVGNSSQAERLVSRHAVGGVRQALHGALHHPGGAYRSTSYRDPGLYGCTDQWHPTADSSRSREMHSEITELPCADNYPVRSSTSDQEASPLMSRYMNRVEQRNFKLHRALNTPRDPA